MSLRSGIQAILTLEGRGGGMSEPACSIADIPPPPNPEVHESDELVVPSPPCPAVAGQDLERALLGAVLAQVALPQADSVT